MAVCGLVFHTPVPEGQLVYSAQRVLCPAPLFLLLTKPAIVQPQAASVMSCPAMAYGDAPEAIVLLCLHRNGGIRFPFRADDLTVCKWRCSEDGFLFVCGCVFRQSVANRHPDGSFDSTFSKKLTFVLE